MNGSGRAGPLFRPSRPRFLGPGRVLGQTTLCPAPSERHDPRACYLSCTHAVYCTEKQLLLSVCYLYCIRFRHVITFYIDSPNKIVAYYQRKTQCLLSCKHPPNNRLPQRLAQTAQRSPYARISRNDFWFSFAICRRPSVCRLSSVCNVRAPYSGY